MLRRTFLSGIDVVILAGGKGTRLREAVPDLPKVLAPVCGRPFLDHLLDHLRSLGARRMILALGHLHRLVKRHVRNAPDVVCSVESSPRGTAGALRSVLRRVRSKNVLVVNGDSLVHADLGRFVRFHRHRRARVSALLAHVEDASRFGRIMTDKRGQVSVFGEKASPGPGHVNAGVYLFRREALAAIPARGRVSLEHDVFPRLPSGTFFALKGRARFIDIGTPESWREAGMFIRPGGA